MEKMTKRNVYAALINYAETGVMSFEVEDGEMAISADVLKAFAENEIALLDKKAAKAKESAAKKRAEVSPLQELVKDALSDEFEPIADIAERVEDENATVGKVSYQLNALVKIGFAEKQEIKIAGAEGKKARKVQGYRRVMA